MDSDQAAIVRRRLGEERVDAETVLNALVQTLVKRHVDCQFEKLGRPIPTHGGQPRVNALIAAMDALHEGQGRNAQDDPQLAAMQKMLFNLLGECQFAAEKKAGIGGDDEPPEHMRLVRD